MERHNASLSVTSDDDLLIGLRQGDKNAFAELYRRYSGRIYGNILKLVKNLDTAEELLQDVFVKLWEKRESIRIDTSFQAYLFVVSKHLVYNFMRGLAIERRLFSEPPPGYEVRYQHVEEEVVERELLVAYESAIDALPPQRQRIYRLCKLEGRSYEEVGNMLGISAATINDHIVKATRFIKGRLIQSHVWVWVLFASLLTR